MGRTYIPFLVHASNDWNDCIGILWKLTLMNHHSSNIKICTLTYFNRKIIYPKFFSHFHSSKFQTFVHRSPLAQVVATNETQSPMRQTRTFGRLSVKSWKHLSGEKWWGTSGAHVGATNETQSPMMRRTKKTQYKIVNRVLKIRWNTYSKIWEKLDDRRKQNLTYKIKINCFHWSRLNVNYKCQL